MTTHIDSASASDEPIALEWQAFLDQFRPVVNPFDANASFEGRMFETYGLELEHVRAAQQKDPLTVWTIIEGEDGESVVVDGMHWVNRLGYIVTEVARSGDASYEIR